MIGDEAVEAAAECDYGEECPATKHDMGCYHEPLPGGMREYMGIPEEATNPYRSQA